MKTRVSSAYKIENNFSEALEKSLISIISKIGQRMDPFPGVHHELLVWCLIECFETQHIESILRDNFQTSHTIFHVFHKNIVSLVMVYVV